MSVQHLRRKPNPIGPDRDYQAFLATEWLITNSLGGYAAGTICGACTRRFHGLLIAALPAPLGRFVMFDQLLAEIELPDGRTVRLDLDDFPADQTAVNTNVNLGEFFLEAGLPVWRYELGHLTLEKRILLRHFQNTVAVWYRLTEGPENVVARLRLTPTFHIRRHDGPLSDVASNHKAVTDDKQKIEIHSGTAPPLRFSATGPQGRWELGTGIVSLRHYPIEQARGYDCKGSVFVPGYFQAELGHGGEVFLLASTAEWDALSGVEPGAMWTAELQRRDRIVSHARPEASEGFGAELVLAADEFIIRPTARPADSAAAAASGDEVRTVIAGYHWFTDWGRDTMISLEGLTLVTGRHEDAKHLLRTFARYMRDGLIPNLFPEGAREGLYHTADATLWYFHALDRYLQATGDQETLELLLPTLESIVQRHFAGTHFGIGVDPADGLLRQGAAGYQLTWMDAKVGDWVVTPRRGKAVEINALWYNALRLLEGWLRQAGKESAASQLAEQASRMQQSFNRRFWNDARGCLFDVVDGEGGDDASLRPNQILAISLEHPVLDPSRWRAVIDQVHDKLLTPFGLRTLAPGDRDYKSTYDGDLRARDAAYHQGTVWAWLIGPYIDAWLRVEPGKCAEARELLAAFSSHYGDACVGSISEIFDATSPYHARGCVAQAWSVAEVLRCWVKTASTERPDTDDAGWPASKLVAPQPGVMY